MSNNQFESVPNFVLNSYGLGVNIDDHQERLYIDLTSQKHYPVHIQSLLGFSAGINIENDLGRWFLGLDSNQQMIVYNNDHRQVSFTLDSTGNVGIRGDVGVEKLMIHGGILLGDVTVSTPSAGSMYFSSDDEFVFVLDNDILSTLDVSLRDTQQSTYLFASHIQNYSQGSRVMMGEQSIFMEKITLFKECMIQFYLGMGILRHRFINH